MSITVGLTKMTYFAKLANLARIHQRSGKKFTASWLLANWRKWQEPIKGFAKPQIGDKEGNGDYKKMTNFGRKREISAKMASMRESHQGFCQIFK